MELGAGTYLPAAEDTDFFYRASRAGARIVYSPDALVYHNHGRRTERDRRNLIRSYFIGIGGLYMKYILQGDRTVLRVAYWETAALFSHALRKIVKLQSAGEELRRLGHYATGAWRYSIHYLWRPRRAKS